MENKSDNNYSQSILDKFRLISQSNGSTAAVTAANSKPAESNGKSSSVKRKEANGNEAGAQSLGELDVGITEYINKLEGIAGILKHRFSDFQVNEIDLEGNVVELTSFDIPKDPEPEDLGDYESMLPEENWKSIEDLVKSTDQDNEPLLIDVTDKTKEERTTIHLALRRRYIDALISNTKEIEDKKYLEIKKKVKRDPRGEWPKGRGAFLHCTVFKSNKDTTELIHLMADKLRLKSNLIGFAGTKDKRGKTVQRMSFKRKTAETLSKLKLRGVLFGNFSYQEQEIRLGENRGNRFQIALRDINASDEAINANMESLRENGFINYFGMQRFGHNSLVPTYAIGKALLASDWKLAIELILKPKPNHKRREILLAQQSWSKDRDAASALRWIPKYDNSLEAKILRTLKSQGNTAYVNALMALPRHTMTLYLHAYQSLIWNRVVSRRIQKFGLKPLPGDLLCVGESQEVEGGGSDEASQTDKDEAAPTDKDEAAQTDKAKSSDQSSTSKEDRPKIKRKMQVREIREDEVDSVGMENIVYPLPGKEVTYPNNEIKTWYHEILAEDNFTFDNFNNSNKHFALNGSYRRLLGKPEDLSWKIIRTDSLDQDLILSDEDKLKDVKLSETSQDGAYKCLTTCFRLESCSYATMALREVMKCDTSVHHQSQLTEKLVSQSGPDPKKMKT